MVANNNNAAWAVNTICNSLLGKVGGALAILGVVACPITSGDTAFRSARLTIADSIKYNQEKIKNRLVISIPLFVVGFILTKIDFNVIWRYFGWSNQALATVVLWASAMYLVYSKKSHWIASLPATFMTAVSISYIIVAPEGFKMSTAVGYPMGIIGAIVILGIFLFKAKEKTESLGTSSKAV
jgi:carbon starvation protein CstA